jgi:hypothetical protein
LVKQVWTGGLQKHFDDYKFDEKFFMGNAGKKVAVT